VDIRAAACVGFHLSNRPVHAWSRLMTLYNDLGRNQVDSYGENRRNRTIKDHRRRAGWRHPMELYTFAQPPVIRLISLG